MKKKTAPFKFLDAYQKEDSSVFFGREEEAETLYDALSGVKHLLVYGPSGAGKTSLIECGLRNQFSDADWLAITIRRKKNIVHSFYEAINRALYLKLKLDRETGMPEDQEINFGKAIEQLFDERFQPIYLLFDQFEELLLLGETEEKEEFFKRLNNLIRYRVPVRILLIMREEFLGHLSEFEPICPSVFKNRFRLEKMRRSKVLMVIQGILGSREYQEYFEAVEPEKLAHQIVSKLPDQKQEIELTHVQVFLSELWDRAVMKKEEAILPIISQNLIEEDDDLETVLDTFLKKQLEKLDQKYGENSTLEVLASMISDRYTKLQVSEVRIESKLQGNNIILKWPLSQMFKDLRGNRIIRAIRSDNQILYEISHDLLAKAVGDNLTDEIRLRERAVKTYDFYINRKGLLSQNDLDHIRAFQAYKAYPEGLLKLIKASESQIQEEQEKKLHVQKRRTRIAVVLLTITIIGLIGTLYFYSEAQTQKEAERQRNIELQWSLATTNKIEGNYYEANHVLQNLSSELANQPEEVLRIQDTISSWSRVDSLVKLSENYWSNQFLDSAIITFQKTIFESPDAQLISKFNQYKEDFYAAKIEEARTDINKIDIYIPLILELKIKKSRLEILEDFEGS